MATTPPAKIQPSPDAVALKIVRDAAKQSKFLSKVFTQGASGLSPGQLTMEFRALLELAGIELPKGAVVGLDVVQIALAGGAVVNDVEMGESILQCAGDVSTGIAGVTQLFSDLGILPPAAADVAGLAANGLLAISSGGLNILADIGAVIDLIKCIGDLGSVFGGSKEDAIADAKKALSRDVHSWADPQMAFAASQATLYQAGKLNLFDFIGNIALNSPLEFKNFFPGLATYFPSWGVKTFTETATSSGWFSSESDTESASFKVLLTNLNQVDDILLQHYLLEPMSKFTQFFNPEPTVSIRALSILSMLTATTPIGALAIGYDFDVLGVCRILGVTPSILGDDWLFKGFMREETDLTNWKPTLPYPPITLPWYRKPEPAGIVINGRPAYTQAQQVAAANSAKLTQLQLYMQYLDEKGDIDTLWTIPEARAMLTRWAKISVDPTLGADGEIDNMDLRGTSIFRTKYGPELQAGKPSKAAYDFIRQNYTIDISNYWKALSVLKSMTQSSILGSRAAELAPHFGSIDDIQNLFAKVHQFVLLKNLNLKARNNLSNSLGIPPSKLTSRKTSDGKLVFYRKVK